MTIELGADPEELASRPALLLDLILSQIQRRVAVVSTILTVLGGNSTEKVSGLVADLKRLIAAANDERSIIDMFRHGREIQAATARLENATFTLILGRVRRGVAIVPTSGGPEL